MHELPDPTWSIWVQGIWPGLFPLPAPPGFQPFPLGPCFCLTTCSSQISPPTLWPQALPFCLFSISFAQSSLRSGLPSLLDFKALCRWLRKPTPLTPISFREGGPIISTTGPVVIPTSAFSLLFSLSSQTTRPFYFEKI